MNKTFRTTILPDQKTKPISALEKPTHWQQELAQAIRSTEELQQRLGLKDNFLPRKESDTSDGLTGSLAMEKVTKTLKKFPVLVPESFLQRMTPGDPNDPLLLQVLPDIRETDAVDGYQKDPVGDAQATFAPGLLQKYQTRALMITLGQCAVHCRYCFRRNFPYDESPRSAEQWESSLQKLKQNTQIDEIILSGGDPLVFNDRRLFELIQQLEKIEHLQRIRVHTRLPIVLPSRITDELLQLFQNTHLQPIFVIHANHPNEVVDDCADAVRKIVRAGIPVLNQAVLLRRINDDASTQRELCKRLINLGAIPYYLHQLDRVAGAAHFEVEAELGRNIIKELKQQLPGYAVPKYVQEIPGESGKTEIT